MGRRKRSQGHGDGDGDSNGDGDGSDSAPQDAEIRQAVLAFYYPRLLSLRTYLLELLPACSTARRRRIELVGREQTQLKTRQRKKQKIDGVPGGCDTAGGDAGDAGDSRQRLADLLDSTIVGISKPASPAVSVLRQRELAAFTQSQAMSSNFNATDVGASTDIADVRLLYPMFTPMFTPLFIPVYNVCIPY